MTKKIRRGFKLSPIADKQLIQVAKQLEIPMTEVVERAVELFHRQMMPAACPKCRREMDVIEPGKWYACPECDK